MGVQSWRMRRRVPHAPPPQLDDNQNRGAPMTTSTITKMNRRELGAALAAMGVAYITFPLASQRALAAGEITGMT